MTRLILIRHGETDWIANPMKVKIPEGEGLADEFIFLQSSIPLAIKGRQKDANIE